jgi:hypothetical protein
MIALIRRIRIERKKMMKKIVKEVLEELDQRPARFNCNAVEDVVIEIGPVEK